MKLSSVLVLAFLAASNAVTHLTPWGPELVYDWKALVKAGTILPEQHASQFLLKGKLYLQSNTNSSLVKITDLTYQIYNGVLDHHQELEALDVPVPVEFMPLTHVFEIVYDHDMHVQGIITEENEPEFSKNMKKAIATIFQLDGSLWEKEHSHPYGFVSQEPSIYGVHDTDYTVVPLDNGIEVTKWHNMKNIDHLYHMFFTNYQKKRCDVHLEESVMHSSKKQYEVVKEHGEFMVKTIKTMGLLHYQPLKAKSDYQYMMVNQSFELIGNGPVSEPFHVKSGRYENDITYYQPMMNVKDDSILDVTNGRHVVHYDKLSTMLPHMLKDIHQYVQEDHIKPVDPESNRGQLINRVQRLLQFYTFKKLVELEKTLDGVALEVFYKILPFVGTKASVLFIKHVVLTKHVDSSIVVQMLKHFPAHVMVPDQDLVTEMEFLMLMPTTIKRDVRKVGVLSFGALVKKAYRWEVKMGGHMKTTKSKYLEILEKKYVTEYVTKVKTATEYREKLMYLFGLYNMKVPSIVTELMPAIHGKWFQDDRLRFASLGAIDQAIDSKIHPDLMMEVLWPVFINRHEIPIMRLLAYHLIMKSKPSNSILKNINEFMLGEKDQELYSYHYTFVKSNMKSNDPCDQDFALMLSQMMQLLPPPSHGLSYLQVDDFQDQIFGFSSSFEQSFMHSNTSSIYNFYSSIQDGRVSRGLQNILIKVDGEDQHKIMSGDFLDMIVNKKMMKVNKVKDLHIEAYIIHNGIVNDIFVYDHTNMGEFNTILEFFGQEGTLNKETMLINYLAMYQMVIPTDLGIPVVWEYMVPSVQYNKLAMTKAITNKVVNINIDNRYVNWIHYRHGLSFYNPIVDVWQGVNRFNSFDLAIPLSFDISLNMQQQILQLSWKKHSDVLMNVGGIRAHVKQIVFVKDDYKRNVLSKTCPHSPEFMVVGPVDKFKHDYVYVDDEDLSTGHKYLVKIYDSPIHMSNGSFSYRRDLFFSNQMKQFHSPLSHLWVVYNHYLRSLLEMPSSGTHGYIVRIEPSIKHPVTSIDLSIRLNSETPDKTFVYTPAKKWSTRITYAVKNEEQRIKTWDVNAIVDMNAGHTVNSLKMQLTRIVPGKQDYKICVDGVKKWTMKGISGHLNVAMSETPDSKCVKDDVVVDVTMVGEHSQDQLSGEHKYGACQYFIPYAKPHYHTMHCLVAHSSVRHYTYNVKTAKMPTEFKKVIEEWWDSLKGNFMPYYDFEIEHNTDIGEHNVKVEMIYPMESNDVDVHITTPQYQYKLTGIPIEYYKWYGIVPESLTYPKGFEYMHNLGEVNHCVVFPEFHIFNHQKHMEVVPTEYTMFVGNTQQNPTKAVFVKKVTDNKIAVKVVDGGHTFEIMPLGKSHQITVDGQVVSEETHVASWVSYHIFNQDRHHPVAVMFQKSGFHIEYDAQRVVVVMPKMQETYYGSCVDETV